MTTLVLLILPRLHRQVLKGFHDNPYIAHPFKATRDKYWNVSMTTLVLLILPRLHRQVLERFHDNPCIDHPS